jgi:hypothetical protein
MEETMSSKQYYYSVTVRIEHFMRDVLEMWNYDEISYLILIEDYSSDWRGRSINDRHAEANTKAMALATEYCNEASKDNESWLYIPYQVIRSHGIGYELQPNCELDNNWHHGQFDDIKEIGWTGV